MRNRVRVAVGVFLDETGQAVSAPLVGHGESAAGRCTECDGGCGIVVQVPTPPI